jgi:hypothetical protein
MAFLLGDNSFLTENAGFALSIPSIMFFSTVQITYGGTAVSRIDIQSPTKIFFRAPSNMPSGMTATIGFTGLKNTGVLGAFNSVWVLDHIVLQGIIK